MGTRPLLRRQIPADNVMDRRVENLERRRPFNPTAPTNTIHLPYGFGDSVTPVTVSVSWPYPMPYAGTIKRASAALTTTGSTPTIVQVYVNGMSVTSVSLGSGVPYAEEGVLGAFGKGDLITVGTTAAGTGARASVATWRSCRPERMRGSTRATDLL